jgi:hypothetical protein
MPSRVTSCIDCSVLAIQQFACSLFGPTDFRHCAGERKQKRTELEQRIHSRQG